VECPRDAIQGLKAFVPTGHKQRYINALLRCGFDTIDFGSFVGPHAIPQMRDTADVLKGLDLSGTTSKLLAIAANVRGVKQACEYPEIAYLGFPLSVNEQFQQRNTKKSTQEAFETVKQMQALCKAHGKVLVVYLSMAFGNPYGDSYDEHVVDAFVSKLDSEVGIEIIMLADTIGCSTPQLITALFGHVIPKYPHIQFGAHFHSSPARALEKLEAAYAAGVRRFDGALGGMGGCPYAASALTGNVATETLISFCNTQGLDPGLDAKSLAHAEDIRVLAFSAPVRELMIASTLSDDKQFRRMCRTHFDAADATQDGVLDWAEFRQVMTDVYRELGEPPAEPDKLLAMFERNQVDGKVHFDQYLEGARQGLQKRMVLYET
jgi:hydroxymethylglutaryl-CoA lyase